MNKETKEILVGIKNGKYEAECIYDVINELIDCTTNLEQEKEEYKRAFNIMAKFRDKALTREWNYKSRIDKAIEYGKELRLFDNESLEFEIGTNFINILNGGDEE